MHTFLDTPPATTDSGRVPRYIPALTGLRAVAAYSVFLHHYNPAPPDSVSYRLFHQGYIGVSIFFVLSGFLIEHRYADACCRRTNWSWGRYAQQRFARIFPLYTLLLFMTIGVNAMTGHPMSLRLILLNLSLLKGFFEKAAFSGIPQSWSLTVEICFYAVAPFLFVHLPRWGLARVSAGLVCLGLIGWVMARQLNEAAHGFLGSAPFVLFYTFFGRAFDFLVGMWLARHWHQNQLPRRRWTTVFGLISIVVCVSWQMGLPTLTTNPICLAGSELVCYNYLLPLGIGALLLELIDQPSFIQRLLSQPIMQALGRSSYAFYLIHTGVLSRGLQKLGITESGFLFGWLLILAYLLYRLVEKPLQEWLRVSQ